ncbi:MAG: NUDIX domain-containing protein [Phycisphaerales bacterium]|nr:NUDIX domain-containing protein [Phycisphaerales bacterium]
MSLPYKIAVLCYLYDEQGHLLLLHRNKAPNAGMYSPIGGKLEMIDGEGPHQCAVREIFEEAGMRIGLDEVRLCGIVSERAYEGQTHWMIFLFELTRPVSRDEIRTMKFNEGQLEWVPTDKVADLPIPDTDRQFMWPLVQSHRGGFFMVHIDCSVTPMKWTVTESVKAAPKSQPTRRTIQPSKR